MSNLEKPSGANDMYDDELDCAYEEGENEEVVVKEEEEEDSETDDHALERVDQSTGNGKWVIQLKNFTLLMLLLFRIPVS